MICVLFSLALCPVFFCLVFLLGMDDLVHVLHVYAAHGIDETNMELMLRKPFLLFARFRTFARLSLWNLATIPTARCSFPYDMLALYE